MITWNNHLAAVLLLFVIVDAVLLLFLYHEEISASWWARGPKPNISVKKRRLLVVGVLSKLTSIHRRDAVRHTWFRQCAENEGKVECKMFTDSMSRNITKYYEVYLEEMRNHDDMVYMPFKGLNFSLRLLFMFHYFTRHYDFEFILRVDDDYFVCLDRLLKELPYRPKTGLYWGWVHCIPRIVRVDEGFMIMTYDIAVEALNKYNSTLLCSAWGDQTVPLWIADSKINVTYFYDNDRIVHHASGYENDGYVIPRLCERYLGVHRAYPGYMIKYWIFRGSHDKEKKYVVPEIKKFESMCSYSKIVDYRAFFSYYYSVPMRCKDMSMNSSRVFVGRG